jgi:hypothetical protein
MDLCAREGIVERDDEAFDPDHRKSTEKKLLIITIRPCEPSFHEESRGGDSLGGILPAQVRFFRFFYPGFLEDFLARACLCVHTPHYFCSIVSSLVLILVTYQLCCNPCSFQSVRDSICLCILLHTLVDFHLE